MSPALAGSFFTISNTREAQYRETYKCWHVYYVKSWLIGKDSDAGRDWGQEVKGTTEDEMAGWHHWLDGRESEWTLGVGDRQGSLFVEIIYFENKLLNFLYTEHFI